MSPFYESALDAWEDRDEPIDDGWWDQIEEQDRRYESEWGTA